MELKELICFKSNMIYLEQIKNNRNNIIPFVGAGISKGCGLYTWNELLNILAVDILSSDKISELELSGDAFEFADSIVQASGNSEYVMRKIRDLFKMKQLKTSELPFLLVSSFSSMVITTNYDTILEDASRSSDLGMLKPLLPCLSGQMNEAIQMNARCLLKIHGSLEEVSSFVFTSAQYKSAYGEKGTRLAHRLSDYLTRIFLGKQVLFVGCSLEKDYTLEILKECIEQDPSVYHYALVPYYDDNDRQIEWANKLSRLGIQPIYYPVGDFRSMHILVNYLSIKPVFVLSLHTIIKKYVLLEENDRDVDVLVEILSMAFQEVALRFSEILDVYITHDESVQYILKNLEIERKQTDTLLNIVVTAFSSYIKCGHIRCQEDACNYFKECVLKASLNEVYISRILERPWSIYIDVSKESSKWILNLKREEIDEYACDIIRKLAYKNGMDFSIVAPTYTSAKEFYRLTSERLSFDIKVHLLRAIASMGLFFRDAKTAVAYLEECIQKIEDTGNKDADSMLFLARCYNDLAIGRSMISTNVLYVLEAVERDVYLKKKYNESDFFYARTLNFYATVLKEINPHKALDVYLECIKIKRMLWQTEVNFEQKKEAMASWALSVFNLGLLAKDLELYEISHRIVSYANKYRFNLFDPNNKDYCSSINVLAELELHTKKNLSSDNIINGIDSRVKLHQDVSGFIEHSWYVCAYYYYLKDDCDTALKYIGCAMSDAQQEGATIDFRQSMRLKLLLTDIKAKQFKVNSSDFERVEQGYLDVINQICALYGDDSYYLLLPYRHLISLKSQKMNSFVKKYSDLVNKHQRNINQSKVKFLEFEKENMET